MKHPVLNTLLLLTATTALAQSPTPPLAPQYLKSLQWAELPSATAAQFNRAMDLHQGVLGKDEFELQACYIGTDKIDAYQIPLSYHPTHKPIDGYKRTHTGMLFRVERAEPTKLDKDDDLCTYIQPVPGSTHYENYLKKNGTESTVVEGEIDLPDDGYEAARRILYPKLGHTSLFGAWVHEKHDYKTPGFKPHDYLEVHPCENAWMATLEQNRLSYHIGVFSDKSGRFNKWRGDPVTSVNAVAFEYTAGEPVRSFVVMEREGIKYKAYPGNFSAHHLKDGNTTLLTVEAPDKRFVDISFRKVSKKTVNGKTVYTGFILLRAEVSAGGYLVYSLLDRKDVPFSPESEVTVTMQEIKCLAVDDSGNEEEIYGRYVVGAVSGLRPFHATVHCTDGTDGTLWYRSESNHIDLKKGQSYRVGGSKHFILPRNGQIAIWGDLNEDDSKLTDKNDALGKPYSGRYHVRDLPVGKDFPVKHTYKSGGTRVEVSLVLRRVK